jgi:mRNA interferase RelE/StbE
MTRFALTFKTGVEKDLKKIPPEMIPPLLRKIETLKENPISRESVKISGAENLYRLRHGEYRIIYQVREDEREVVVHYIRHRKVAYRNLP